MAEKLAAIILPMYNEELSVPLLRKMFDAGLEMPEDVDFRLVAVNDGSEDATLDLINAWARENPRVTVVSHAQNQGVGQAILTGFGEAIRMKSFCAVTLDADASHPGSLIKKMISEVERGNDIVIASRFAPGGRQIGVSPIRKLYSVGARLLLNLVFPLKGIRDYTVGFRAYNTSLLNRAFSINDGPFLDFRSFATSAEILLKMVTVAERVSEVPLVLRYDQKQSPSKLKTWATIKDYFKLFTLPGQACKLGRGLRI